MHVDVFNIDAQGFLDGKWIFEVAGQYEVKTPKFRPTSVADSSILQHVGSNIEFSRYLGKSHEIGMDYL